MLRILPALWPPTLQEATADPFRFNQLLETLLAFSLVKRLSEDRLLSIHRLVQAVQVEHLSPQQQRQWAERLVRAIKAVFPRDPKEDVASWPQCVRYLDQVQACDTLIREQQLLLPEAAEVLGRAGTYLRERGLYTLAEPLFQRALSIREQQLGPEHPLVASTLHGLADLYAQQGEYERAEPLFQRALHIREQQLGSENALVADPLRGLATLYTQQGKYPVAEPLFQRALRICEQRLGAEHLETARVLHDFACFHQIQGQIGEAALMYQRALLIREHALGPSHPTTSDTKFYATRTI